MKENGYELDMTDARLYHEIYLSDLRKYDINRLKQLSDILLKRLDNLLKVKYMKEFLNEVRTPIKASLNVFSFFIGMTVSYHLYTIYFSDFNPKSYMMIWHGITLISPILAYICWYAKGKGKISLLISSIILLAMLLSSFDIGIWYFDINSIIDLLLFIGTVLVLYMNPKKTIYSLTIATVLAYIVRTII